jgi:Ca2+-binding EF-hand superfamily protein
MKKTLIRLAATAALVTGVGAAVAFAAPGPEGRGGFGPGPDRIDFPAIDANKDGRIDRAELTARATERLAVFDLNGDGQLDRAELVAILPAPQGLQDIFAPNPAERMADRILAMHGQTATGTVPLAAMAEQRVNLVFAAMDDDGDGILVLEETQRPDGPRGRHGDGPHGPRGDGPRG